MDEVLEQLKAGVRRFQTEVYPENADLFAQAVSERQRPHTLFITCADSRIDPNMITSTGPGEVFVTRNIGNMVPAYGEMLGGVSAVIEFAVGSLAVKHIVVCGHTQCGAMQALLHPESVASMPTVTSWLKNAHAALGTAQVLVKDHVQNGFAVDPIDILTEQNVLLQMQHLKTHPSVAASLAAKTLTISGWVYNIGSGEIEVVLDGEHVFRPIAHDKA
jgi:carbonic anhydrase